MTGKSLIQFIQKKQHEQELGLLMAGQAVHQSSKGGDE